MNKVALIRSALLTFFLAANTSTPAKAAIPAEEFFKSPDLSTASISPDGKNVALIKNAGTQRLVLTNSQSGKETLLINVSEFSDKEASISRLAWLDNQYLAAQLTEIKKGVRDLLDTKTARKVLVIKIPNRESAMQVLSVRTSGRLVSALPDQADAFLYAKSGSYSKVYRIKPSELLPYQQKLSKLIKVDNGQFKKTNEIASIQGYATRWFFDNSGAADAVLHYDREGQLLISTFDKNQQAKALKTWSKDDLNRKKRLAANKKMILPVAKAADENSFYGLDMDEDEERSVYLVNFKTNETKLVYEANAYRVVDLIIDENDNRLLGVQLLKEGEIRYAYLDQNSDSAEASDAEAQLSAIVDESLSGDIKVVYEEAHNRAGRYFLLNKNGKTTALGSIFPHLNHRLASRQVEGSVVVEGLTIPYLLTLPKQAQSSPAPLVVHPHGGPIDVFDSRYFDLVTQFLAANGFAVLRVNFRGSSGYSTELKEAGKREWGNLMLTDIYRATQAVVARNDIDAEKVCAFGLSYGGYAATMLTVRYPELYRCAANVSGVTDVNLHVNKTGLNAQLQSWFKENIGDSVNDYERLKSISPVYAGNKLSKPLLILHGEKDRIVEVEHAHRLYHAAKQQQTPVEIKIYPEQNHYFLDSDAEVDVFRRVMTFLKTHL